MDEQPVQLAEEARISIAATKDHPTRVDYEYKRKGTAHIFMFAEPLACCRKVSVRPQETEADWAIEMADLLEGRDAKCDRVIVVPTVSPNNVSQADALAASRNSARKQQPGMPKSINNNGALTGK